MNTDSKLKEMLTGYATAHQHLFNVAVHLIQIPVIMLGIFVPLSWLSTDILGATNNLAHVATFGLFLFYISWSSGFSASSVCVMIFSRKSRDASTNCGRKRRPEHEI